MVIDFHTHAFPEKIAAKTLAVLLGNVQAVEGIGYEAFTDGTMAGIKKINSLPISQDEKDNIFFKNAMRLLKL